MYHEQAEPLTNLREQVAAAQRELQAAQNYFEMVCEPTLVDTAIYRIDEAHRKYQDLFRQLRRSYGLPTDEEVQQWN